MIKCFLLLIKGHCGKHRWWDSVGVFVSATIMQPQDLCQPQFLFQPWTCVSHKNDEVVGRDLSGAWIT